MTEPLARSIADRLLIGSLEGAIVIALVGVVCWRVSTIPPAARAVLWWLASLNLVLGLLPLPAVTLPLLPAAASLAAVERGSVAFEAGLPERTGAMPGDALAAVRSGRTRKLPDWRELTVLAWLAVVAAQASVLLRRFRRIGALVERAAPCSATEAASAAHLARVIGLRRLPDVRTSTEVRAPQVTGVWQATVLLPAGDFTAEERTMMLCHELVHVRRRDLAFGWVPAVAERLFFFHPLARIAAREYVTARESACDSAVVRTLGVSPADYGRLLIRFGVGAPEPALTAGASPLSRSSLRRRLEMLPDTPTPRASRRASWIAAGVVAALVPLQLAARAPQKPAPPAPAAPSPAPRPVAVAPVAEPAPAAPQPARAVVREPRPATESSRRVFEVRSRQRVDEAVQRQSEEATRAIRERQEAAEQRRREMELSLRQLIEEYRQRLLGLQANFDTYSTQASLEQLARETRGVEQEVAEREIATAAVRGQLEQLKGQQDVLLRQLERIAQQQDELSAAQQRLREETERIRKQLEAAK